MPVRQGPLPLRRPRCAAREVPPRHLAVIGANGSGKTTMLIPGRPGATSGTVDHGGFWETGLAPLSSCSIRKASVLGTPVADGVVGRGCAGYHQRRWPVAESAGRCRAAPEACPVVSCSAWRWRQRGPRPARAHRSPWLTGSRNCWPCCRVYAQRHRTALVHHATTKPFRRPHAQPERFARHYGPPPRMPVPVIRRWISWHAPALEAEGVGHEYALGKDRVARYQLRC